MQRVAKNVSLNCSSCFLPELQWRLFAVDYKNIEFCSIPGHKNFIIIYIKLIFIVLKFFWKHFPIIKTYYIFSASKVCTESLISAYIMKAKIQVLYCFLSNFKLYFRCFYFMKDNSWIGSYKCHVSVMKKICLNFRFLINIFNIV